MKYSNEQLKKIHVQQMGQFACGLACLSAITNYHQGSVTQEKLREISGTTLNGTSLLGLYHAAEKIGFNAKGLKGDLEHLKLEDQPAILHVILDGNQEHFVVYYGYRDNHFIIGDPAVGIKSYSDEALGAIWKS